MLPETLTSLIAYLYYSATVRRYDEVARPIHLCLFKRHGMEAGILVGKIPHGTLKNIHDCPNTVIHAKTEFILIEVVITIPDT